jgi:hypothetical protein
MDVSAFLGGGRFLCRFHALSIQAGADTIQKHAHGKRFLKNRKGLWR